MKAEAVSKLKAEMDKEKNSYVQIVGNFLLQHLEKNPSDAEKIMKDDKTIIKSLDEMMKVAQKQKVGNVAVLSDQEGFAVVLKYFEIDRKPAEFVPKSVETGIETKESVTKSSDFDVTLEDFLQ